jgi:MGT family glycosyltransferase
MEALRRPCVYLSLGSQISWQPEIFRRVLEAVRGRPVQLVASMGELLSTLERPPENLIAVRYAPQLRILPRADLLITHGGANSVMEALCFGVPILIHPICNDQPHQAWFLEECGVGRRVDLEKDDVWKAIESLLAPTSSARVLAQRVRKSYEASSGAIIAAGLIEHLGATGRPIVRKSDDWMQLTTAKLEDFLHEGIARP